MTQPWAVLEAVEYDGKVWEESKSGAARVRCDDGCSYVFKGARVSARTNHGKEAANDQIVGRLANVLFPSVVPRVTLIDLSPTLIARAPELTHLVPGVWHGTEYVPTPYGDATGDFHEKTKNYCRFLQIAICGIL